MQRFAFTMTIKPDRVGDYVECHKAVWPSVLDAIRRSGIRHYSIFLEGNKLFFFVEAEDVAAAFRYLDADPEHARWNREVTAGMFEGSLDVGAPAGLPEVFRFSADD
jgi:L-rhamnose mutarotase